MALFGNRRRDKAATEGQSVDARWNARELRFLSVVEKLASEKDDFVTALELRQELRDFHNISDEIEKHDRWGYLEQGKDRAGMWGRRLSQLGRAYLAENQTS